MPLNSELKIKLCDAFDGQFVCVLFSIKLFRTRKTVPMSIPISRASFAIIRNY